MSLGPVIPSCGLANLGNMCYMNAALQCLFSSTQFTKAFNSSLPKTDSPLLCALGDLLDKMRSGATHADASKLKDALGSTVERFSSFSQQDSQEFLTVLLESLHNALTTTPQKASVSPAKLNIADLYEMEETFEDSSWNGTEYKLDTYIEFPDKLQVPNVDQQYNLIAVINHRGAMSGGHYVAVCKRGDSWFCFNDLSVTSCRDRNFVTKDAYVLFYEQVKQQEDDMRNRNPCQPNEPPRHENYLHSKPKNSRVQNTQQTEVLTEVKTDCDMPSSTVDSNGTLDPLPLGYRNYSNNNHLNAVLQCLKATQPFHAYLQSTTELGMCHDIMEALKKIFNSTDEDTLKTSIESLTGRFHHRVDDPQTFLTSVFNELHQKTAISETIKVCSVPIGDERPWLMKCDILQESQGNIQSRIVVLLLHRNQCCQSTTKFSIVSATVRDGPPTYSLYGVICRNGMYMYYAYCKIKEQWYEFCDESVWPVDMNESSIADRACILFYQKDL
eukprot:Em0010g664a